MASFGLVWSVFGCLLGFDQYILSGPIGLRKSRGLGSVGAEESLSVIVVKGEKDAGAICDEIGAALFFQKIFERGGGDDRSNRWARSLAWLVG